MKLRSIEAAIPHRAPFLFLDEIVDITDTRVIARRTVRADEPQFQGHYPQKPVMPGVLLCEAIMQAGCYLMVHRTHGATMDGVPVVARMNDVKFKQMVVPGDVIEIACDYDKSAMGVHFMSGQVRKNGKTAVSLSFAVTVAKES